MILKIEYIVKIRRDDDLLLILAKANGVRVAAIERWLRDQVKYPLLTTAGNLEILKGHFKILETSELLTEDTMEQVR